MNRKKKIWIILLLVITLIFETSSIRRVNAVKLPYKDKLVILHTNDSNGRVADDKTVGLSGVSALRKEYESLGADVLVFDVGDTLYGSPFATIDKGADIVTLMNEVGYDAMVPGNRDFYYGTNQLIQLEKQMKFPLLAANFINETTKATVFSEYYIFQIGDRKIGVFGLCTPDVVTKSDPSNIVGYGLTDCIDTAKKMVNELKLRNVDQIIALGHIGTDEAYDITSERIIEAVDGIDIFIDGHSHSVFEEGKKINQTLLVSAGKNLEYVGVIEVGKDSMYARVVSRQEITSQKMRDPKIDDLIRRINEKHQKLSLEVVSTIDSDLYGERGCSSVLETSLGNYTVDAMRSISGSDVAIIDSTRIHQSLFRGDITKNMLFQAFPFGDQIVTIAMNGYDLWQVLEYNLCSCDEKREFLQVSGLAITYDPNQPNGEKIVKLFIGEQPIISNRIYVVAINENMLSGEGDFKSFTGKHIIKEYGTIDEVVETYLKGRHGKEVELKQRFVVLQSKSESRD